MDKRRIFVYFNLINRQFTKKNIFYKIFLSCYKFYILVIPFKFDAWYFISAGNVFFLNHNFYPVLAILWLLVKKRFWYQIVKNLVGSFEPVDRRYLNFVNSKILQISLKNFECTPKFMFCSPQFSVLFDSGNLEHYKYVVCCDIKKCLPENVGHSKIYEKLY